MPRFSDSRPYYLTNDGGRFESARIALATATRDCAAQETRAKLS